MWTCYHVTFDFITPMYGSVPTDPDIIAAWIKTRQPRVRPPGAKSAEEINEEVLASLGRGEGEAPTEYQMLVFQRHGGALCVRYDTIRAHIKDCARVISNQLIGRITGERAFSTRVVNGVYLDPRVYWVPILRRDGSPVTKPDGERDKAVHPRPGISGLKRLEYLDEARLVFTLMTLGAAGNKPSVREEDLHLIFQYGGLHGYGGERSADGGKYTYTLRRLAERGTAGADSGGVVPEA